MTKKSFCFFAVLALLAATPVFAAQSRTTEYHKMGVKIATAMTLNIKLPDGYFVTGSVKGPTGSPVKDAIVLLVDAADGYSGFADGTDASGAFSVPVQPGAKILVIGPPASASLDPSKFSRLMTKTLTGVGVSGDTALGDIKLENGYVLSGKITPPAGSGPLFMFTPVVEVFPPTGLAIIVSAQTGGTNGLVPDRYAVALPAGSFRVLSRASGAAMTLQGVPMAPRQDKLVVAKDTVRNLAMAKGGYQLSGTLKDSSKKGLDGWLIIAPKSGPFKGWPIQIAQVSKGVFGIIPGLNVKNLFLPAGAYKLMYLPTVYLAPGYAGRATVTYYDLTMPAAAKTLALTAANGFLVSGKATNAAGSPVRAFITAYAPDAPIDLETLGQDFMGAVSDANGGYRFALPADTFNIHAIPITNMTGAMKPEEMLGKQMLRAVRSAKR